MLVNTGMLYQPMIVLSLKALGDRYGPNSCEAI